MQKKMVGLMTAIALSMIVAGGLWAQSLPNIPGTNNGIFSSPQSDASQGRMRSNADDFIRPDAYTNVQFEKWFGITSYGQPGRATAGLATKVGGLYLSAFYNGNFWAGRPANNYTETEKDLWGDGYKTYRDYGTPTVTPTGTRPINNAAILLGVGDMGFRLTYQTNYLTFKKSDIFAEAPVGGPQYFKSYKAENGYISPQIAWSMTKDLTAIGIKPYVTVDLTFQRDSLEGEVYLFSKTETSGEVILSSKNYFEPKISFGLGGVTVFNKDGFKGSVDLDNDLYLRVYNNEYTYLDSNYKPKSSKIKGLNDEDALTTNSYARDVVTPSASGSWSSGNVALRFKLNLPMTITGTEVTEMDIKDDKGTLQKDGDNTKTSTFTFQPDLRLALSWKVFPKLALYVGGRLRTTPLTGETVTVKTYTDDKEDEHSTIKKKNNSASGTFTHNLRLGTTFNISDNVWVEAQTGLWDSEGKASVFGTGSTSWGLFEFSSILIGLKF